MSLIKHKLPCPKCGGSDPVSLDEKGAGYCFSCDTYFKNYMSSIILDSYFSDPVVLIGLIAFLFLLIALPIAFWNASANSGSNSVRLLIALANLALTSQLVLRWWQSAHFPVSNLYESLCFLTWGFTLTQLLIDRIYQNLFPTILMLF